MKCLLAEPSYETTKAMLGHCPLAKNRFSQTKTVPAVPKQCPTKDQRGHCQKYLEFNTFRSKCPKVPTLSTFRLNAHVHAQGGLMIITGTVGTAENLGPK